MDLAMAKKRLEVLHEFCASYLQSSADGGTDGGDYGVIPGASKKRVLFKSGGEKLTDVYGLAATYKILTQVEDFETGLFDYTIECRITSRIDDSLVGSGLGSCNSYESKYRWREEHRVCPQCGKAGIIRGKAEYGGGWLCWRKNDGCGAKFAETDPSIVSQKVGRIQNEDLADIKNTVLKIARKRCFLDAVISVTRSSGLFTTDLEDLSQIDPVAASVITEAVIPPPKPVIDIPPSTEPVSAPKAATTAPAPAKAKGQCPKVSEQGGRCSMPAGHAGDHTFPVKAPVVPLASVLKPQAAAPVATTPVAKTPGAVLVTAINVRNGPMVTKDGVSKPAWGPLFVVAFNQKITATDGTLIVDASTFDEKIVLIAENARDDGRLVKPTVQPGKRKGVYELVKLEIVG
jgi:hypothetical protein